MPIFEIKTKVEEALNVKLTDRAGSIQKWFSRGSLKKTIDIEVKDGAGLFPDTSSFSVDEVIFKDIHRKTLKGLYGTYDFFDGAPYRETGGLIDTLNLLINHQQYRDVPKKMIHRIFREIHIIN